jgi:hypothetical protein
MCWCVYINGKSRTSINIKTVYSETAEHVTILEMLEAVPPLRHYVFMSWFLIKQWIRLHGVVLS